MGKIGDFDKAGYNRTKPAYPKENQEDIYGILPKSRADQYDMMEIIKRLVDNSEFDMVTNNAGKILLEMNCRLGNSVNALVGGTPSSTAT